MTKSNLNQHPRYKSFIEDRNRVLEELMAKCRMRADFAVQHLIEDITAIIPGLVFRGKTGDAVDHALRPVFDLAEDEILGAYIKMRRLCYTLAYVGEAEAIARSDDPTVRYTLDQLGILRKISQDSPMGGTIKARVRYYLDKLRRRVLDVVQLGTMHGKNGDEVLEDLIPVLPRPVDVVQPRRVLRSKRLQEATIRPEGVNVSSGFVDDSAWNEMVDEYLDEWVLDTRTKEKVRFKGPSGKKAITRYEWELERDFTHDFVTLVRQGAVDAARENGYTDFVWIAVIDNKTDECCTWRDGLTTSEIETQLKNVHKDDECKTTVAPAHPFCRCDIAPVTDAIEKFTIPDVGDFDTWLTNP